MQKEIQIQRTQSYSYIKKAIRLIGENRNPEDFKVRYHLRQHLLQKAIEGKDYNLALAILKDLDHLEGYYGMPPDDGTLVTTDFEFRIIAKPKA